MRTRVTSEVLAVIYLGRRTKTLHIYQLEYLGCPPAPRSGPLAGTCPPSNRNSGICDHR